MNTQDGSAEKLKWSFSVAIDRPKGHNELNLQSPEPNIDVDKIFNFVKLYSENFAF